MVGAPTDGSVADVASGGAVVGWRGDDFISRIDNPAAVNKATNTRKRTSDRVNSCDAPVPAAWADGLAREDPSAGLAHNGSLLARGSL